MSTNIAAYNSQTISNPNVFSFESISKNENRIPHYASLSEWMRAGDMVSLIKEEAIKEENRIYHCVHFDLAEAFASYFPLLRGIFVSSMPSSWLHVSSKSKTFVLKYDHAMENEAMEYLSKIFDMLKNEVRFKQVLKKIIVNQQVFEREQRLLFTELSN